MSWAAPMALAVKIVFCPELMAGRARRGRSASVGNADYRRRTGQDQQGQLNGLNPWQAKLIFHRKQYLNP
jgi:hypothetical protein